MEKEALFYEKKEGNFVRCFLCSHYCRIAEGDSGFCRVRRNAGGMLKTMVYGEAVAANVDPVEKKPLYHFLPGSRAYSIGTPGCNFHCGFCQNWQISQAAAGAAGGLSGRELMPEAAVENARRFNCASIAYTYTEPTIFFEYAFDTARLASENSMRNVFVTNGYITAPALDYIKPYLDAANVDLKSFREGYYKKNCEARLKPVLKSIEYMRKLGIWIEVTTLVIPGENDSTEELKDIAQFIASAGMEIPWHISRFHADYKFTEYDSTPSATINAAMAIGREAGLKYVYAGNVGADSSIKCPGCERSAVERGFSGGLRINLKNGKCAFCGAEIEGVWE